MIKKLILYLLALILLSTSIFGASLKLDSFTTTPSSITPGDEVDLTLRVQNVVSKGEDSDYSYKLELNSLNTISKNNIIIIDGEDYLGKLGVNEYWNSKFTIKIIEGAPSATYQLEVSIKKYLGESLISTTKTTIDFEVLGDTFFKLDSDQKTIEQGETKLFNASLQNVGGASAGNVKLIFGNTNDIQIVGSNSFYFSNVGVNDIVSFPITLHASNNLDSGTYNFPVTITYDDGTEIKTQNIEAGIIVGGNINLKIASIQTTPKEIRPGDNYVLLAVNLENAGEDDAKSISSQLKSKYFKSSYSNNNLVYAGRIDSGSYSTLNYYINIPKNTLSGIHNLNLTLDYMNLMGENFKQNLFIPIYIKEKPILEIKSVEAQGKAGNTIKVKINVQNLGEEDAQEVDIRLISDSSLPFSIEERSIYLGSIKSNETSTAIFDVKVSPDAQIKDYNIRALIRARGDSEIGDNNIYTYNKDITIKIDGKAINKIAIFGFLVAIIVIIGLLLQKNKNLKLLSKK